MAKKGEPTKPPNGLKRLEDKLLSTGTQTWPNYVRANYEQLAKLVAVSGRRGDKWQVIAGWAVEEGIVDSLTAPAAQRAFERETKRRQAAAESKTAVIKTPTSARPAAAAQQVSGETPERVADPKEAARARMRLQLKPISIRKRDENDGKT